MVSRFSCCFIGFLTLLVACNTGYSQTHCPTPDTILQNQIHLSAWESPWFHEGLSSEMPVLTAVHAFISAAWDPQTPDSGRILCFYELTNGDWIWLRSDHDIERPPGRQWQRERLLGAPPGTLICRATLGACRFLDPGFP
jgi:hypothetical protein